jgi:hypothetical protein
MELERRPPLSELTAEQLQDRAIQYRNMAMYASTEEVRDALIRMAKRYEKLVIERNR